jgi:hypothetical protein
MVYRYRDETNNILTTNATQVLDLVTGLAWQRSPPAIALNWSVTGSSGSVQSYCNNLSLGNRSWRVPSVKELESILVPCHSDFNG